MTVSPTARCDSMPKENSAGHWPFVQSWFYHGLLSFTLYSQWEAAGCNSNAGSAATACADLYHTVRKAAGIGGLIDSENVHKDHCSGNGSLSGSIEHTADHSLCPAHTGRGPVYGYKAYLNNKTVQAAVHVEGACLGPTASCGGGKDHRFHYTRSDVSVITNWRRIFAKFPGLKILICECDRQLSPLSPPPWPPRTCQRFSSCSTSVHRRALDSVQGSSLLACSSAVLLGRLQAAAVSLTRKAPSDTQPRRSDNGDQDIATNPSFLTQSCLHELAGDRNGTSRVWASWTVNDWHAGFVEYFGRCDSGRSILSACIDFMRLTWIA